MDDAPLDGAEGRAEAEARLRGELRDLRAQLLASQEERASARADLDARMADIRQRAKEHVVLVQGRMQGAFAQKDARLAELQQEAEAARQAEAASEQELSAVADARGRVEALQQEREALHSELQAREAGSRHCEELRAEIAQCELDIEAPRRHAEETAAQLRSEGAEAEALQARLQELRSEVEAREGEMAEVREEVEQARRSAEGKTGDIVQKAKDHMTQLQTRLATSMAEAREVGDRHKKLQESHNDQQEKVAKYKTLMMTANSRIEEGAARVRDYQETHRRLQAQVAAVQERMQSFTELQLQPPTGREIADTGGVLMAVEAEDHDVWCFLSDACCGGRPAAPGADQGGSPDAAPAVSCRSRWWLLSQLELEEKPVPMQRRYKGEILALRARASQFQKRSEDLQEEFNDYRQRASEALKSSVGQRAEGQSLQRQIEQLGVQVQVARTDLEQLQREKASASGELTSAKARLEEALLQHSEQERAIKRRVRELERDHDTALRDHERSFRNDQTVLEQTWCKKELEYQKELDLRRTQRDALEEEIERLRLQLAVQASASVAAPAVVAAPTGGWEDETVAASEGRSDHISVDGSVDCAGVPALPAALSEVSSNHTGVTPDRTPKVSPRPAPLPPLHGYSLQVSVARQDLMNLRAREKELEVCMEAQRDQQAAAERANEELREEVREVTEQQHRREAEGQRQQMEYIRNVFRRFIEEMPISNAEHEQLIPVLMTFFHFGNDEARAIQSKRQQHRSQASWKLW